MADYWRIFAEEVPAEMGLNLTPEQIDYLTDALKGAAENEGLFTGRDCIPNPQTLEVGRLEKVIQDERLKVHCRECDGTGRIITLGPCHSSNSGCWKCNGEGRHLP